MPEWIPEWVQVVLVLGVLAWFAMIFLYLAFGFFVGVVLPFLILPAQLIRSAFEHDTPWWQRVLLVILVIPASVLCWKLFAILILPRLP